MTPPGPRRAAMSLALGLASLLAHGALAQQPASPASPVSGPPVTPGSAAQQPAPTPAQTPVPPAASEPSTVDAYVARAAQRFQQGAYLLVVEDLQKAYAMEPRPLFLFNLGQAYRRAQRPREAIDCYQRFLDAAPSHELVPEARGYLTDMKLLLIEQQRAELAQQALALEQQRAEAQLRAERTRAEAQAAELQAQLQAQAKAQRERADRPFYKKSWFWGVTGTVLAVGIVGAALGGYLWTRYPDTAQGEFHDVRF